MGKALLSLVMPYMKSRTINSLRKEGALNITLKPEEMTKPAMDQARIDLANASKVSFYSPFPPFQISPALPRCICGAFMGYCAPQVFSLCQVQLNLPNLHYQKDGRLPCSKMYPEYSLFNIEFVIS